jgi:leader peptidase (prepilin peptidase)/N-methyltransferase
MTTARAATRRRVDGCTAGGVVSAALLALACWNRPGLLAVFLAVTAIAVGVSREDLATRRIPNRGVGLVLAVAALGAVGSWVLAGRSPASALAGLAIAGGPVFVFHLASPAGMGFGDVKWSAALGAVVGLAGWSLALLVPLVGSLVAIAIAVVTHQRFVAFGPALAVGALVALTIGPAWIGNVA